MSQQRSKKSAEECQYNIPLVIIAISAQAAHSDKDHRRSKQYDGKALDQKQARIGLPGKQNAINPVQLRNCHADDKNDAVDNNRRKCKDRVDRQDNGNQRRIPGFQVLNDQKQNGKY